MRILLMGEFSGLFKNLKEGLLELGQDVVLMSDCDGWKKIGGQDLFLESTSKKYTRVLKKINDLKGYDIVQIISPNIYRRVINLAVIKKLKKQNFSLVLSAAGDSYLTYKAYRDGKYRYCWLDGDKGYQNYFDQKKFLGKFRAKNDLKIVSMMDGIIPIAFEYAEAFRNYPNLTSAIPIPINCKKIKYSENLVINNKISFFHGINREIPKGSYYIINAMKRLKEKYPNDVEIIIKKRMPIQEYMEEMSHTNVVLDQCKSYSLGLNALYAMAEGKIVLGGNESESRKELGIDHCPVFNILPNESQILETMEHLLENKVELKDLGHESRKYVEKNHEFIKVSEQYLKVWKKISQIKE